MNDRPHQLRLRDVSVNYGEVCALEGIDFQIDAGRTLALIGPNGAGKSTLLKSIAGLVPMNAGEIEWRSHRATQMKKEIAYLAQRSEVDWNFPLTVRGLVEMGRYPHLGWWRKFGNRDHTVVDRALEKMHLFDLADRQISALSGGQQQRAFVARALAQEATVFLLDEPFTGLDRPSQDLLTELFGTLAAEGHLVIASHHDLDTVTSIFDEAVLVNQRLISAGPVDDSYTEAHLATCFGAVKTRVALTPDPNFSAERCHTTGSEMVLTS